MSYTALANMRVWFNSLSCYVESLKLIAFMCTECKNSRGHAKERELGEWEAMAAGSSSNVPVWPLRAGRNTA